MAYLSWISDEALVLAVRELNDSISKGLERAKLDFDRNVLDPFSALYGLTFMGMSAAAWQRSEQHRQAEKSLSNAIGIFHQKILASVPDWKDLNNNNSFDIVNNSKRIIAEIKNKHNTLNASALAALYHSLSKCVKPKSSQYYGYTAYYVVIIPKTSEPYNKCFTPSDNSRGEKCPTDDKIRTIDGRSFYELVTGDSNALLDLFTIIPVVAQDCGIVKHIPAQKDLAYVQELFSHVFGK